LDDVASNIGLTLGTDCFVKCKPCHHGTCELDGSCKCVGGWLGADCSVPKFVECLPCSYDHGRGFIDNEQSTDVESSNRARASV